MERRFFSPIILVGAGIIGFFIALTIYGITPLDVTNDKWIYNGYMEPDIIQHYAGWLNYRNSDWCFPFGKIQGVNHYSNYVSFTDSIPLLAMGFKLIEMFLPKTFQYFGIYVFICFVLQSIFSYKILSLFIRNTVYKYIGILLFLLSPIMIERAFRHTALTSHWIILASIYLYFKSKRDGKISFYYTFLLVISMMIHPYFIPMVCAFMAAITLEQAFCKNRMVITHAIGVWISSIIVLAVVGYSIGLFGWIEATKSETIGSYGYFTTDLNSFINPISQGYQAGLIPKWSLFLPIRNYAINTMCDGFNYWGLGMLISFPLVLIFAIRNKKRVSIKKYWGYITIVILFILYGYSNTIWLDGNIIFSYDIPKILFPIVSSFKSSGRYLWPVTYSVLILIEVELYRLVRNHGRKSILCNVLIGFIVACQFIDISQVIMAKRRFFDKEVINSLYVSYDLYDTFDNYIDGNNKYAIICDPNMDPSLMYKISFLCGKNGLKNNFNIMNRGDIYDLQEESYQIIIDAVMDKKLNPEYMYFFKEKSNADAFVNCLDCSCEIIEIKERNSGNAYIGYCDFYLVREKGSEFTVPMKREEFDSYQKMKGNCSIEQYDIDENSITITGWAYIENMNSKNQMVYASVEYNTGDKILLPVIKSTRYDIANTFKNENYLESGFYFHVNQDNVKSITFIVVNEDAVYYFTN